MNPAVPFLSVRDSYLELKEEIDAAQLRVLDSGRYLFGEELEAFERDYADYCGARYCIGVGSGLAALHLALLALGVGPGDEVVVPSNTYIATWLAVTHAGAAPVPVEPDVATYNLDPDRIGRAITRRTRAILPVHLYGQPADMDPILDLARQRGLAVLADAAQAHGSRYGGRRIGELGDAVAWSFYPGKNLGSFGDGGAVTTDSEALADRIRALRNYGSTTKNVHEVQGVNSRLDEMQAAVLRVKLRHLDEWNRRRADLATYYLNALAGTSLGLPAVPEWAEPAWHLFVVRAENRDSLRATLARAGVEALVHYPVPPHRQPAYAGMNLPDGALPVSERIHREVLSLPLGPHLSRPQAERVVAALGEALETGG